MKSNILFCLLVALFTSTFSQQTAFVAPSVWEAIQHKGKAKVFVILKTQADLSGARAIKGKNLKGEYTFNQLRQTAEISQKPLSQWLSNEGIPHKKYFIVNTILLEADSELLYALSIRPEVDKILNNSPLYYHAPVERQEATGKASAVEWGVTQINAEEVWALGYKGAGVVVGGQDTGYDWEHPAIKMQYRGWNGSSVNHNYNWHDAIHAPNPANPDTINPCGYSIHSPCDDQEHGTHTMGTMVGEDGSEQIGVAPMAKWIGVRNMERGWGSFQSYIESFQWFIAPTDTQDLNPDPSQAPHVINNSWGCPLSEGCDTSNFSMMESVINTLKAAGIVTVVSAGNDGSECNSINSPAAIFQNSFTVGATDFFDNATGFSSRGAVAVDGSNRRKPDVVAPGLFIRSCVPGGEYGSMSGTSMAGPHVAGAVALLISAKPSLAGEVDSILYFLQSTAVPLTTEEGCEGDSPTDVPNNTFGYGRIDIYEAVLSALNYSVSIPKPTIKNPFSVFPSPVNQFLTIRFDEEVSEKTRLSIFQANGKSVLNQELQMENQIDISALPSGIYFCKIITEHGAYSHTIWVE